MSDLKETIHKELVQVLKLAQQPSAKMGAPCFEDFWASELTDTIAPILAAKIEAAKVEERKAIGEHLSRCLSTMVWHELKLEIDSLRQGKALED